jgi:aminoglycoside phosphotransferase (APT) family kinase protein
VDSPSWDVRALCEGFGLPGAGAAVVPVGRGAMGRLWKLTTTAGTFAVKEALWDEGWTDVRTEVGLRDAAVVAGVLSPAAMPTASGDHVLRSTGSRLRLYEWVVGATLSGTGDRRAAASWLGATLGRLHALRVRPGAPPDPWYETVPSTEAWRSVLRSARTAGQSWHRDLVAHAASIRALAASVTPSEPASLVLCHLDVQAANVLRSADGAYVLLDWDDVGAGAPDRELASVLVRWFVAGGDVDGGAVAATLASYRQHGGTAVLGPGSFAMQASTALKYVHAQASVALDEHQPPDMRAFAVDQLQTALRTLPAETGMRKVLDIARM